MLVYLSKCMLTQVLALTLVGFSNMNDENWTAAMPNFRTMHSLFSKKTTHGPLVVGAYNFINSQTCDVAFSLFFEKSRQCHSGVVKLSTGAIANSLKTAVAPTHD